MSRNNAIVIAIIAVVVVGSASFFIRRDNLGTKSPSTEQSMIQPETKQSDSDIEILAKQALDRKIPQGNEAAVKELKDLSLQLKNEPNYLQGWLQVGILRKYSGDYEGASLAWQYATLIRPNDYIAFSNLGDLYHYYLHAFPKAEKYLRKAVDLKPDYVAGYKNLFDLYALSYKEKTNLAEPILLEGIKKNPSDTYLQGILNSYRAGNL